MAIAIKSVTTGTDGGGSATVSLVTSESPTATQVGDLVVVIHCNDFRALTNMVAPIATGTPTMSLQGSADGGTDLSHIKVWTYVANTAGAQSISSTETGSHDGDKGLTAYVLSGADTSTPVDGSLVATLSPSTSLGSHVLTGVTTSNSSSFLLAHIRTSNGAGTASFTPPGSMTERYDVANFTRFTGATEQLSASGATGTRTFTPATSVPFVAVMFAVNTASAGSPPAFVSQLTARRRKLALPRRARAATPVAAQVDPPFAFAMVDPARRVRGMLQRRGHAVTPVPAQAVAVAPAYPPRPVRARLRGLRLFRPHAVTPVPAQVILTPPAYPPLSVRTRLRGLRLFRGRAAAPVPTQVVVIPGVYVLQAVRARQKPPVFRRHDNSQPFPDQASPPQIDPRPRPRPRPVRSHIVTPPLQTPAVPLFTRARLRTARIFRGDTRMAAPPQVVLIAPPRVAQATRARRYQFAARRHRGGVDGWMVPGVHLCVTPRPNTGTTVWDTGITARPDTGTTEVPC